MGFSTPPGIVRRRLLKNYRTKFESSGPVMVDGKSAYLRKISLDWFPSTMDHFIMRNTKGFLPAGSAPEDEEASEATALASGAIQRGI